MSHNWIFLIYCYFISNCPVLSFFLLAERLCGVVAVFSGDWRWTVHLKYSFLSFF